MDIIVSASGSAAREVEIVERKGRGHPDSVCDALADAISLALSRLYLERAGRILHHNVDKILLAAGSAEAEYGGGRVVAPINLYLGGRVTREAAGQPLPVDDIAIDACRRWFASAFHALDAERHVRFHPVFGTAAPELAALHAPGEVEARAGDSSIGVGFAPFTPLERLVRAVEDDINAPATKKECPELGEDVKVLGVRVARRIELSVACAFIAAHVRDLSDYLEKKARLADRIASLGRTVTGQPVAVSVNAGDLPAQGNIYLTVTGTSAEQGDDGEVGRGNRANGLITPCRPMSLEASSGKSPRNHVGRLYQVAAQRIAASASALDDVRGAECLLASRIGLPLGEAQVAEVRLSIEAGALSARTRGDVERIVRDEMARVPSMWRDLVAAPG